MPSNVYIASVILVYTIHKVCGKTLCVHQISIHSTLVSLLFSLRPLALPHRVIPPVNARWWDSAFTVIAHCETPVWIG